MFWGGEEKVPLRLNVVSSRRRGVGIVGGGSHGPSTPVTVSAAASPKIHPTSTGSSTSTPVTSPAPSPTKQTSAIPSSPAGRNRKRRMSLSDMLNVENIGASEDANCPQFSLNVVAGVRSEPCKVYMTSSLNSVLWKTAWRKRGITVFKKAFHWNHMFVSMTRHRLLLFDNKNIPDPFAVIGLHDIVSVDLMSDMKWRVSSEDINSIVVTTAPGDVVYIRYVKRASISLLGLHSILLCSVVLFQLLGGAYILAAVIALISMYTIIDWPILKLGICGNMTLSGIKEMQLLPTWSIN